MILIKNRLDSGRIFIKFSLCSIIYGEYMPYYYVENCPDGNYEKLIKELSSRKVAYTDLKKLFKEDNTYSGVELYHKLDSHWNNLGASLAYMEIWIRRV